MTSLSESETKTLHKAYARARLVGILLCVAWPLAMMLLVIANIIKPGQNAPVGAIRQLSYTFTGLVFLSAAFVTWRSSKVLKGFRGFPTDERPRIVFKECLLYAAIFELSCLYGLLYWLLVGLGASKHVGSFMALTPLMFFVFIPRFDAWKAAAEAEVP